MALLRVTLRREKVEDPESSTPGRVRYMPGATWIDIESVTDGVLTESSFSVLTDQPHQMMQHTASPQEAAYAAALDAVHDAFREPKEPWEALGEAGGDIAALAVMEKRRAQS